MKTPYQRKRERSNLVPAQVTGFQYDYNSIPPNLLDLGQTAKGYEGSSEVMVDTVTPDFKKMQSKGQIVTSPMYKTTSTIKLSGGVWTQTQTKPPTPNGSNQTIHTGKLGLFLDEYDKLHPVVTPSSLQAKLPVSLTEKDLQSRAAISARNKVNPILVQSLVSAVEMRKTLKLLRGGMKDLMSLADRAIKGGSAREIQQILYGIPSKRGSKPVSVLSGASKRYLEYRFGWRILVLEIQGVIRALDPSRIPKVRGTARSRMSNTLVENEFVAKQIWSHLGVANLEFRKRQTIDASAYVMYEADLNYQLARDWGLLELPLTAWELIPLSWIADYFVSIGSWLEALTPKVGVRILHEGCTVQKRRSVERRWSSVTEPLSSEPSIFTSAFSEIVDTYETIDKSRTTTLGTILMQGPPVNVRLDVPKLLDIVSVIHQILNRGKSSLKGARL